MMRHTPNRTSNQAARDAGFAILHKMYSLMGIDKEMEVNYRHLADVLEIPTARFAMLIPDFEESGVMVRRYEGRPSGKPGIFKGKKSLWKLPFTEHAAQAKLTEYWKAHPVIGYSEQRAAEKARVAAKAITTDAVIITPVETIPPHSTYLDQKGREGVANLALATREKEETRAIAGPEAKGAFEVLRPDRKDESVALVEAARQYADRQNAVRRAFEEMEKLGVKVNWDHIGEAVEVVPDERLAIVVDLLPYITTLEKRVERLAQDNVELRDRNKGYGSLQQENDKLRDQNRRLIAEKVGASTAMASRS
jgi:hypothetical protein